MQTINNIITAIFDALLAPFSSLPPVWGLVVVSILTGIVMVIIFKHTSNQKAIRAAKDKISAGFLEVRLFKDDLGLMLDAQKRILRANLTYMRHSFTPMLVMIVPVILILAQLGVRYQARPLRPGESALVKLKLSDRVDVIEEPLKVETSEGLRLETPILRIPAEHELDFRIGALVHGEHRITLHIGDETFSTPVIVSDRVQRVYSSNAQPAFMPLLLAPGQTPLPKNSALEQISISLPSREIELLGLRVNWLVLFFIASIIAGYSLKGVFRVEI
ncbi:MAG: hypothetical protein Kow0099_19530 [Candidatus Abyssubacteria bacterium]